MYCNQCLNDMLVTSPETYTIVKLKNHIVPICLVVRLTVLFCSVLMHCPRLFISSVYDLVQF